MWFCLANISLFLSFNRVVGKEKAVTGWIMTAFPLSCFCTIRPQGVALCVDLLVVVNRMGNALAGNFSALELLHKHCLLLQRLVLFKKVLQL